MFISGVLVQEVVVVVYELFLDTFVDSFDNVFVYDVRVTSEVQDAFCDVYEMLVTVLDIGVVVFPCEVLADPYVVVHVVLLIYELFVDLGVVESVVNSVVILTLDELFVELSVARIGQNMTK
ncbi:rh18 [macacine betaherpesvirus 3]|uniref:Rh18 n=1 Tax=Rhesus cytomegalovirus (strain 68-1) TaxID=47929 RepID=Q7TFW3_RHCM6|nr:rh18 [macacine betaherpesvirus 3]AAP50545.1 rh18 [macacine betaherpesvirus 3]